METNNFDLLKKAHKVMLGNGYVYEVGKYPDRFKDAKGRTVYSLVNRDENGQILAIRNTMDFDDSLSNVVKIYGENDKIIFDRTASLKPEKKPERHTEEIIIRRKGNKTYAAHYIDGKKVSQSHASKHKNDEDDFILGSTIAFGRMVDKETNSHVVDDYFHKPCKCSANKENPCEKKVGKEKVVDNEKKKRYNDDDERFLRMVERLNEVEELRRIFGL